MGQSRDERMKKFYFVSFLLLAVLNLMSLLIAAIATAGSLPRIAATFSLTGFGILQAVCLVLYSGKGRSLLYRIGFFGMHAGLLCVLCGLLVYAAAGDSVTAQVPVADGVAYSNVLKDNGRTAEFGFSLSVDSFRVEKDPETDLDTDYEAVLLFSDGSVRSLKVNRPLWCGGWKIYLMSWNETAEGRNVILMFKRDPAEFLTTAGFAIAIAGSFLQCFGGSRPGRRKEEAS